MLSKFPDEIIQLILMFLPAHDLCSASAVSRRVRVLANHTECWKPLALFLPGLGPALAAEPVLITTPWRRIVATWLVVRASHAARLAVDTLRREEQTCFNRARFHRHTAREAQRELRNWCDSESSDDDSDLKREKRKQLALAVVKSESSLETATADHCAALEKRKQAEDECIRRKAKGWLVGGDYHAWHNRVSLSIMGESSRDWVPASARRAHQYMYRCECRNELLLVTKDVTKDAPL